MADPTELHPGGEVATAAPSRRSSIRAIVALLFGLVFIAWAGDAFLDFAETIHSASPLFHNLDVSVHDWCVAHRTPLATWFFVVITTMGGPVVLSAATAIIVITAWLRHHRAAAAFLTVTVGIGYGIDVFLKGHYARARPEVSQALRGAHGYSFPSGHAMGSAFFLGAIVYLLLRSKQKMNVKLFGSIAAVLFFGAVCWSRVYLGVHWMTDVLAGAGLGVTWLIAVIIAQESLILVHSRKSHS